MQIRSKICKQRIVFDGYYGYQNTGDDAFIEVVSWGATNKWGAEKYRFLGKQLPMTKVTANGYPLALKGTYSMQARFLISQSDYFISAGGSTFHNINPTGYKYYAKNIRENNSGLNLGAIGVSIGPFDLVEHEREVIAYLREMNFLCLRDEVSYEYAKSLGLPYEPTRAFDLAALLPLVYGDKNVEEKNINSKRIIGISICNYESYVRNGNLSQEQKRNKYIEELLRRLDNEGNFKFCFFIFNNNPKTGDLALTNSIIAKISPKDYEIVPYYRKTEKMWNKIKRCDLMLSTRLHAGILACFAGVPFFMIEYHRKCSDFLHDVGYFERYRIYDAEKGLIEATDCILKTLEDNIFIKPKYVVEMTKMAMLNFDMVKI